MNSREKTYLIVIIFLLITLAVKSFYFDEVKKLTSEEEDFKNYVYRLIDEKYDGYLKDNGLTAYRVVSIRKVSDEGTSVIEVYNEEKNRYENVEIEGKYKAKIRKYLFKFIPYGEDTVLSRK